MGCGNLFLDTELFDSRKWQEVRIDINPAVNPDIVSNITEMNAFEERSVDVVWSTHNLEHLYADEVNLALQEFYRVLILKILRLNPLPGICGR